MPLIIKNEYNTFSDVSKGAVYIATYLTVKQIEGKIDKCSVCELQNINMSQQISMEHLPEILIISMLR